MVTDGWGRFYTPVASHVSIGGNGSIVCEGALTRTSGKVVNVKMAPLHILRRIQKVRPVPPKPSECCENGCTRCVWEQYFEEMRRFHSAKKEGAANEDSEEQLGAHLMRSRFAGVCAHPPRHSYAAGDAISRTKVTNRLPQTGARAQPATRYACAGCITDDERASLISP